MGDEIASYIGKEPKAAKQILEAKGVAVPGITNKAIQAAAQSFLREFFNDVENLWVGNSVENSTIKDAWDFPAGWSPAQIDAHVQQIKAKYLLK